MHRKKITFIGFAAVWTLVVFTPGCKKTPPEQAVFPTDQDLGSDDEHQSPLLPNRLSLPYDDTLFKTLQGSPNFDHLLPPPPPEMPEVHDLLGQHNQFVQAQDFTQAAALYAADYQETARQMLQAMGQIGAALKKMQDDPSAASLQAIYDGLANLSIESLEELEDGTVVAQIKLGSSNLPNRTWVFLEASGQWLIAGDQQFTALGAPAATAKLTEVNTEIEGVIAGLEDGALAPAEAAALLGGSLQALLASQTPDPPEQAPP